MNECVHFRQIDRYKLTTSTRTTHSEYLYFIRHCSVPLVSGIIDKASNVRFTVHRLEFCLGTTAQWAYASYLHLCACHQGKVR